MFANDTHKMQKHGKNMNGDTNRDTNRDTKSNVKTKIKVYILP